MHRTVLNIQLLKAATSVISNFITKKATEVKEPNFKWIYCLRLDRNRCVPASVLISGRS